MSIKNTDFKEELDILFKAILKLENEDECYWEESSAIVRRINFLKI